MTRVLPNPVKFKAISDRDQARLTVVETLYHQRGSQQPIAVSSHFSRLTGTDQQPYVREFKVGDSWQPLDTGWIQSCGYVLILNSSPNPERLLEVSFQPKEPRPADCLIPPGDCLRCYPVAAAAIHLRANQPTDCQVYIFPEA